MLSDVINKVDAIMREVALAEIMPRFRKLADSDIEMKGVNDPVTVADKAAEKALILRLMAAFPGSVVVGEEGFAADPALVAHFSGEQDVWVIDPIDGTRNFIEGKPEFGIMIAQVRRNQTVAAWIHDPNSGDMLVAERGAGVWLNGQKMRLAGQEPGLATVGLAGSKLRKILLQAEGEGLMRGLPALAPGSAAAFDYARLFTGPAQFANSKAPRGSYIIPYRRAMPWDHMAGLMMVAESGGVSSNWQGQPYDASQPRRGLIVAATEETHNRLRESLKTLFESQQLP